MTGRLAPVAIVKQGSDRSARQTEVWCSVVQRADFRETGLRRDDQVNGVPGAQEYAIGKLRNQCVNRTKDPFGDWD
jgi:hypothetical protein